MTVLCNLRDSTDLQMEYDDIISPISNQRQNQTTNPKIKQSFITINFMIQVEEEEKIFSVRFLTSSLSLIDEIIDAALEKFNDENFILYNKKEKPLFKLQYKRDSKEYELKPSKKNGKPKEDYPPFNHRTVLCDTQQNSFSLLFNPNNLLLKNISPKDRPTTLCKDIKCLIY